MTLRQAFPEIAASEEIINPPVTPVEKPYRMLTHKDVKRFQLPEYTAAGLIIRKAADLIEENGWIKGSYGLPKNGFCTVGALRFAKGTMVRQPVDDEYWDAIIAINKHVGYGGSDSGESNLIYWNDSTPGKTKESVVASLRKAAESFRIDR